MPQVILSADRTLYNQRTRRYVEFIKEYELIKQKLHPEFGQVQAWTKARRIDKRNFLKYYNRYKQSGGDVTLLLPLKRGPRYRTRRADLQTEQQVKELREKEKGCTQSPEPFGGVQGTQAAGTEPPQAKRAGGKAKNHQRNNGTTGSYRYVLPK
jgi:hypothetical protein